MLPSWNTDLRLDVCYTVDYERLRRARFLVDPVRDDCRVRREVNIVEALDDNFSNGGEQRCEKRCVAKFWRKADALEWSLWVKSVCNGNYARPCNLIRLLNPRLFASRRDMIQMSLSNCLQSLFDEPSRNLRYGKASWCLSLQIFQDDLFCVWVVVTIME